MKKSITLLALIIVTALVAFTAKNPETHTSKGYKIGDVAIFR